MAGVILPLPDASVSELRSAFIITTLQSCIEELVQNSIDAQATEISVFLRRDQWSCRVQDNGTGIRPQDLKQIGLRYRTSKAHSLSSLSDVQSFGFRGEALASLVESSVVEVLSRHEESPPEGTASVTLRSLEQGNLLAAAPKPLLRAGTVVQIRDLFFKWPVRRKTGHSSIEAIKRSLEIIALNHPAISFTLIDQERPEKDKLLSIKAHATSLSRFRYLCGSLWVEFAKELNQLKLDDLHLNGFLSFTPANNSHWQFICMPCQINFETVAVLMRNLHSPVCPDLVPDVNGRPLQRGSLHQAVLSAFDQSNWANLAECHFRHDCLSSPRKRQKLQADNPRKGLKRHPVFCLDITLPNSQLDLTIEPSKKVVLLQNELSVTRRLYKCVQRLLADDGYRTSSGRPTHTQEQTRLPFPSRKTQPIDHTPSIAEGPIVRMDASKAASQVERLLWTDPTTGRPCAVDSRTGNTLPLTISSTGSVDSAAQTAAVLDRGSLRAHPSTEHNTPSWIGDALANHQVTTFASCPPQQPEIPSSESAEVNPSLTSTFFHSEAYGSLNRARLRSAQLIGQLDKKFIVVRDEQCVFLVDQHAASERIRVERYLGELCSTAVDVTSLQEAPPLVLIHRTDLELVFRHLHTFHRWGLNLECVPSAEGDRSADEPEWSTMAVTTLPKVAAKRLEKEPHIIQGIISQFLAQLRDGIPSSPQESDKNWTSQLGSCPSELLDVINSRACRGAIMFGDRLDIDQCQRLLHQLSETYFPFQCAHGRPSVMPLASVAQDEESKRPLHWERLQTLPSVNT